VDGLSLLSCNTSSIMNFLKVDDRNTELSKSLEGGDALDRPALKAALAKGAAETVSEENELQCAYQRSSHIDKS